MKHFFFGWPSPPVPEAGVTQSVFEVFGTSEHPAVITQSVFEVFGRPPEISFVNDRVPGLTHIEITLSDGSVEAWSVIPMDDPLDYDYGRKAPRVLAWADIRRSIGDFYGTSVAADFRLTVRDKDLRVLGYLGDPTNTFINRYTVTRSIGDPDRRQQLARRVIFRGPIRSVTPRAGATHEFAVKDYLQERFGPNSDLATIPRRKVLKTDFSGCEATKVNSSAEGYVVSGAHPAIVTGAPAATAYVSDGSTSAGATSMNVRTGDDILLGTVTFANHPEIKYTVLTRTGSPTSTAFTFAPQLEATVPDGTAITVDYGGQRIAVRAGVGTFANDQIVFGNHATVYQVSGSLVGDPEIQMVISPALTADVPDGSTITQTPTYQVEPTKGNVVPCRFGLITDRKVTSYIDYTDDSGDGQGKPLYVGDELQADGHTYAMFVWACHGCYAPLGRPIQQLYFFNEAVDNLDFASFYYNDVLTEISIADLETEAGSGGRILLPGYDNWTDNGFTTSYVDRNGRRYVLYGLRGIFKDWALGIRQAPQNFGGVTHAVNGWGADSNLDGTGSAVRDPHEQFILAFNNFAWGDYQHQAPLANPTFPDDATLTLLDLASFARAKAHAATLVDDGFVADWSLGVDNEQLTMAEFVKRGVLSMGVEQSWNRKTQLCIDRQIFDEDTAMVDAATLTDERDIKQRSYEIDERPSELFTALRFTHTRDELGRTSGGWRSTTADFNVADQPDEYADTSEIIARYSPSGTKLYSQALNFYWLRGKNRDTDADEYQQGSDTINAILAYKLAMAKVRVFSLTTWGRGYSIDVFDRIWIKHFANVGWRVPRPARVIEHDAQPDRWRVTLKCFDLRGVFGAQRHTLTVGFGDGDGEYYPGVRVLIAAHSAPSGTAFDRWVGAGVENPLSTSTWIRMGAGDTTVTATFAAPYNVIIQVPVGSINMTGVAPSTESMFRVIAVPIGDSRAAELAETLPNQGPQNFANDTLDLVGHVPALAFKFLTIPVPVGALTLTGAEPNVANSSFKTIQVPVGSLDLTGKLSSVAFATGHTVSVENGTGSGHFVDTTVVSIAAGAPPSGMVFDAWTHATVASPSSSSTTLTVNSAQPRAVHLDWDANAPSELIEGYVIVWGTTPGVYPNSRDAGNVLSYWLTGLTLGTTYYISIKAYNATDYSPVATGEVTAVADTIVVTATYR